LHITSIGNSKSNGFVERFNGTITESMRCSLLEKQNTFENHLLNAILGYNNSLHSSTKYTPFEVINGHNGTNLPFDLNEERITQQFISDRAEQIKVINNQIHNNLEKTKQRTCEKINANRNEIEDVQVSQ
jgi:transposase InsO family protein